MRRLRPIRRRRAREEAQEPEPLFDESPSDELQAFVPVESAPQDDYAAAPEEDFIEQEPPPARVRRAAPRLMINFAALVLVALLLAAGVVGTLVNLDRIDLSVPDQWPWGLLALALLWLVVALARRQVTPALGAAALVGASLSALLDVQGIAAWRETMIGAVLVALGLGIVLRGLLLRQNSPA